MNNIEKFFFKDTIEIPSNVKIQKKENFLIFEGPLGIIENNISKIDSAGLGFYKLGKAHKLVETNKIEIFVKKIFFSYFTYNLQ